MTTQTLIMRPMTEVPTKTGRYAVLHRGCKVSDAFYWTPEDISNREKYHDPAKNLRAGWQQLPSWGPTHWIDLSNLNIPFDSDFKRYWANESGIPCGKPQHSVPTLKPKKTLLQRIFSW